jgi:hypothetical protein
MRTSRRTRRHNRVDRGTEPKAGAAERRKVELVLVALRSNVRNVLVEVERHVALVLVRTVELGLSVRLHLHDLHVYVCVAQQAPRRGDPERAAQLERHLVRLGLAVQAIEEVGSLVKSATEVPPVRIGAQAVPKHEEVVCQCSADIRGTWSPV